MFRNSILLFKVPQKTSLVESYIYVVISPQIRYLVGPLGVTHHILSMLGKGSICIQRKANLGAQKLVNIFPKAFTPISQVMLLSPSLTKESIAYMRALESQPKRTNQPCLEAGMINGREFHFLQT